MWAPTSTHLSAQCNIRKGERITAWMGVADGKTLLHWSNETVNGDSYLRVLQTVVR